MHRLPDGMNVAHQTDESFCKIAVVRQRPQRRPIPVNNDRFIVQRPASFGRRVEWTAHHTYG